MEYIKYYFFLYYPYIIIFIVFALLIRLLYAYKIKKLFKVPFYYLCIGTDLGNYSKKLYIKKSGINGVPDAAFYSVFSLNYIIGEFKSRSYKGKVYDYEKYQITLYMGHIKNLFSGVEGYILYGCGTLIEVEYDHVLYKKLIKLKPEVVSAKQNWIAPCSLSLINRK